jgi:hypothetical protein
MHLVFTTNNILLYRTIRFVNNSSKHTKIKQLHTEDINAISLLDFFFLLVDPALVQWTLEMQVAYTQKGRVCFPLFLFNQTVSSNPSSHKNIVTCISDYRQGLNFHFSMSSRPALRSTQPPIQWVSGALSPGVIGRGVNLTTYLKLVPRSRKYGCIHPLPQNPSWQSA